MNIRKTISFSLKCAIVLNFIAILIVGALSPYYIEGYKRLLYFTAQSNVWIGGITLTMVFFPLIKRKNDVWEKRFYTLKYVFTVSITITGIVFCFFLAPFAKPTDRAWTVYSILSHVVAPVLCIADYFIDDYKYDLSIRHVFYSVFPPLIYYAIIIPLCLVGLDFGHGKPYPYFFLNFYSQVNFFSFSLSSVRLIGGFYWMLTFTFITIFLGIFYARIKSPLISHKKSPLNNRNSHRDFY